MSANVNWENLEVAVQKDKSESECLSEFIRKYSIDGTIGSVSALKFKVKFYLKSDKEKFLLDAYTDYRSHNSPAVMSFMLDKPIDIQNVDIDKLVKYLNLAVKKHISFNIRNKSLRGNHIDLLIRIKGKDKKLFKEARKWKSEYSSDYFMITLYKDRAILKDFNFFMKRSLSNRILDKTLDFFDTGVLAIKPYKTKLSDFLNKFVKIPGIKYATFTAQNLDENPILDVICRRNCDNISVALKTLISEGKLTSFEQLNKFSLKFEKRNKPIYMQIEHKLKNIDQNIKAITLKFSNTEFSTYERKILDKYNINENYLYYEYIPRNLQKDIDQLIFKRQLKIWEEWWFAETLSKLSSLNLIHTEKRGVNLNIDFSYGGFIEFLLNYLSQHNFNPKKLSLPKLGKGSQDWHLIDLAYCGQHFLFLIFLKEPSEKVIQDFKLKWLNGLSKSPLFLVAKESEYQRIKVFGDFPHLNLSETLVSILNGTFNQILESKIKDIQSKYNEERSRESRKILNELKDILDKKQSKTKFREFEEGIYYLQSYLFTGTQRISGSYLPDGIRLPDNKFVFANRDIADNLSIWDAKIWFSDFDIDEEKDKIARYILASLKYEDLKEFGKLKNYFIIGHIENPNGIHSIFNEARNIALGKANRYKGVTKKDIKELNYGYIDFGFFQEILPWINSKDTTIINKTGFYNKLSEFIISNKIIDSNLTKEFIKKLDEDIANETTSINLKKYREIGKKVKKDFDSIASSNK